VAWIPNLRHLRKIHRARKRVGQRWLEVAELFGIEHLAVQPFAALFPNEVVDALALQGITRAPQLQATAAKVAIVDAGTFAQLGRQFWEERDAARAQPPQGRARPLGIPARQDAGTGPRGFLTKVALVQDGDAYALAS